MWPNDNIRRDCLGRNDADGIAHRRPSTQFQSGCFKVKWPNRRYSCFSKCVCVNIFMRGCFQKVLLGTPGRLPRQGSQVWLGVPSGELLEGLGLQHPRLPQRGHFCPYVLRSELPERFRLKKEYWCWKCLEIAGIQRKLHQITAGLGLILGWQRQDQGVSCRGQGWAYTQS